MEEPCDFYYSAKQAALTSGLCHTVRGKRYTEVTESGSLPIGDFDDYVLVLSGVSISEIKVNYPLHFSKLTKLRRF